MNTRENYLALMAHEPTEWVPNFMTDVHLTGGRFETWENGPIDANGKGVDGLDAFGTTWVGNDTEMGQPTPDETKAPLADVCDWEDVCQWPDLDKIDWQEYANAQLAGFDRSERVLEYHSWNSVFLRFTDYLGFEEGLCSFLAEPEASHALCEAIADYKIALLERVAKYIKPDIFVHYDDVATARSLFVSPETYREFIKPQHARINDACRSLGIIPCTHVCGFAEDIIEDLIEEGSEGWQSAQCMNDLEGIIQKYGDRLAVIGGFDMQGPAAQTTAADADIIAEANRCIETYGRFGYGYAFFGGIFGRSDNPDIARRNGLLFSEVNKKAYEVPARLRAEGKIPLR